MRKILLLLSLSLFALLVIATPPSPTVGYRWVLLEDYSDEFNGTSLDAEKWNDFHKSGWQGRKPAKFVPEAISVKDGYLQIQNGVMETPVNGWEYTCGAVSSKGSEAHFGYYECSFKASLTTMSTTFWLSNEKVDLVPGNCATDRYSQELDIAEAIGDAQTWPGFGNSQKSNTHFRYQNCSGDPEIFYSKGATKSLGVGVAETFNTYASWWHDENFVTFYANDKKGSKVAVNTEISEKPFDRPMYVCMVTETYDWEEDPTVESLNDDTKNTSYYDWVRAYKEVPIDQVEEVFEYDAIYEESVVLSSTPKEPSETITFIYEFKANEKRELNFNISKPDGSVLMSQKLEALKGFGKDELNVELDFEPEEEVIYTVSVDIRPVGGTEEDIINTDSFEMIKEPIVSVDYMMVANSFKLYPNPAENQITIEGLNNDALVNVYSQTGQVVLSSQVNQDGIVNIAELGSGIYFIKIENQIMKFVKN